MILNNLRIMPREHLLRRFTRANSCPICGGHDGLCRGQGVRCFGYYDRSGTYARCTREEMAGGLAQNRDGTYSHRLHGSCRCGQVHGQASTSSGGPRPAAPSGRRRQAEQRFRSYFTLTASLRRFYGAGTAVRFWVYRDGDGHEVFRILRIDYEAPGSAKAKSYRPCHQCADGAWSLAGPALPLPLYNLPAVLAALPEATVTVLEGEKCVDIAAALGLSPTTTSAHGAQAPQLTDWTPLAGRHVALLRDEGARGADYACKVAALLAALDPPAQVLTCRLPGLADGEDIEQFAAGRRSRRPLRRRDPRRAAPP